MNEDRCKEEGGVKSSQCLLMLRKHSYKQKIK